MRAISLLWVLLLGSLCVIGQNKDSVDARNSYWLPNKGTIRVFLVYAEALNDPNDPGRDSPNWKQGELPKVASIFFDPKFEGPDSMKAFMTEYFYYASFGNYLVLGDYYPYLIQVEYSEMRGMGVYNIIDSLNLMPGEDLITSKGYSFNGADFDNWKTKSKYGMPSLAGTDGYVDMLIVLWRVNSRIRGGDGSGYIATSKLKRPIKGKLGFMAYSQFISIGATAQDIMKHEYSHGLYGGNNFHTGGAGRGRRTFMQSAGGYSNMSSWDHTFSCWNAWDRYRMGWKPKDHIHQIGASVGRHNVRQGGKINIKDFPYGGVFVLKDFISTNDAIQIKLPHIKAPVANQYLWLENHQIKHRYDYHYIVNPGIQAYIQVGKDDLSSYGGPGNYTMPVPASGRYDFVFHKQDGKLHHMELDPELSNPLSGAHFLMMQALDINEDGIITERELYNPDHIKIGDQILKHHPDFGNNTDAFSLSNNAELSLDDNPPPTTIMTYTTPQPKRRPAYDNDTIFLSGLSVKILEENVDGKGAVEVAIRWNDYVINKNVRWCGKIVLQNDTEDPFKRASAIQVHPGAEITVDRGLTPVTHKIVEEINDKMYFSDPSVLIIRKGSSINLMKRAKLKLQGKSKLILEEGAELIMGKKSSLLMPTDLQIIFKGGFIRILGKKKDYKIEELDENDIKHLRSVKFRKFRKTNEVIQKIQPKLN